MKKFIYWLFLLLPFIDLSSSVSARFFDVSISIGGVVKGLLFVFFVLYCFFLTKSKYKKTSIMCILFAFLFSIIYLLVKPNLGNFNVFISEINYLIKFLFYPIVFFSFLCLFDDIGFNKNEIEKLMLYTIIVYAILLILPILTGTSFNTYENGLYGMVGWFYAANEISTILVLLFPFTYLLISNKKKYLFLGMLPILLVISYVGTKVTLFGLVIVSFIILIISYFYNKNIFKNPFISSLIIFVVILLISIGSYSMDNFFAVMETPSLTEYNCVNCEDLPNDSLLIKIKKYGLRLLSQRNYFLKNTNEIYLDNLSAETFLFGLGFNNNEYINNNNNVTKLIEMDILDMFYHLGIFAIILFLIPFIFLLYLVIKNRSHFNRNVAFYILMILMSLGISTVAGHAYMAPAVSIYIIVYEMLLVNELDLFKKEKINSKKIVFLALHMGYGGVENAIASQASMLSENYQVEIVSLYKQNYKIPFKLSGKVKVIYLMNTVSNRQEFISNLKGFHLIRTLKEGIKSFYILINKNSKIIKYIISSDTKIIISTRYKFSKLLNKYGRKEIIKISEQHVYDISDKYITKLNKLKNIDYLMPVSRYLYDQYNNKLNIKMKFIPLSLNYFPNKDEISKVNTKNLIAIGRLDNVKGFIDLIKIMQIIVNNDNNIHLNIFGDGPEKEKLIKLIKEYNLNKNIKLWGFKEPNFIKKYWQNSSLYLMTSYEESFGLVVIESMSYGIPCIAFDSAKGVLDAIKNGENGFIINERNNKEYANKVLEYINMSAKNRKSFSKNARLTSEQYKYESIRKMWLEFLENIK